MCVQAYRPGFPALLEYVSSKCHITDVSGNDQISLIKHVVTWVGDFQMSMFCLHAKVIGQQDTSSLRHWTSFVQPMTTSWSLV